MNKLLVVAGEASGDFHASLLVRELKKSDSSLQIFACGGNALAAEGVQMVADLASHSVVGGLEVLKNFTAIRAIFKRAVEFLDRERPDAVILLDYPGFNLRLAAEAKQRGIKVIYYISPQIWAWAPWRIKKIRSIVDLMLVILPFEKDLYVRAGIPVRYVGHPSLDRAAGLPAREAWLVLQHLNPKDSFVGLLPGSRAMEIENIFPVMLEAACEILRKRPETRFLIPCASDHLKSSIEAMVQSSSLNRAFVSIVDGQSMEVARSCDLAVVASGTATLETALMNTPMLIVYKVNSLTYMIARLFVRLPYVGLVNVLAGKQIAPEFLQHRARGSLIAKEALSLLADKERLSAMKKEFEKLRQILGPAGASERAAHVIVEWLQGSRANASVS